MKVFEQIKYEEGLRLKKYLCTANHFTIGYGHNIDSAPYFTSGDKIPDDITQEQADELLACDIGSTIAKLRKEWPRFDEFDKARRDAFINMAFQLGVNGFMRFERMRAAAIARDWTAAHKEALHSNWAKQTPERALRVAGQIKTGKYYDIPTELT